MSSQPIKSVQFVNTVSFGGQKQSLNRAIVGDRPGQTSADIEIDEKHRFISLKRKVSGVEEEVIVPMTNVASFMPFSDAEMKKLQEKIQEEKAKEEAKKPAVANVVKK